MSFLNSNLNYLIILFFLVLVSCNNTLTTQESDVTEIVCKLNDLADYTSISPIVDSVVFIPLQHSSKESFIGNIDKIIMTDNHIAIMDVIYKKLNLYDTDGNYLTSIGQLGNGPHEYIRLDDFQIYNDTVYLLDPVKRTILAYSTDNQFLFRKKIPFQVDAFAILDNCQWLWGLSSYNTEAYENAQIILTDENFKLLEQSVKYDMEKVDTNFEMTYYFMQTDHNALYHRGLDNNVYVYEKNSIAPENLYFDFKGYNISKEYLTNIAELMESNVNYCFLATTPILTDTHIMGVLNINGELHSFIHDRTSGQMATNSLHNYNPQQINLPFSLNKNIIVSYFNNEIFPDYQNADFLNEKSKACLDSDDYVLVKYYLR